MRFTSGIRRVAARSRVTLGVTAQNGWRHPFCAVTPNVTRDLAATRRMPDVNRIFQIEVLDQFRQVIRVRVEIVAIPRLTRPAMPTPVMGDAAVAALRQK